MVYIGADHRGFRLKEDLKKFIADAGFEVSDIGAAAHDPDDDYPDFAAGVAQKIAEDPETHRGILLCGSGHGVGIAADKFKGVRAALAFNLESAIQSREHDDANVLVLAADWISPEAAREIVIVWLKTPFSGETRHMRRLRKIKEIEERNFK